MSGATHTPGPWLFRLEAARTVIFHEGEIGERAIAVGAGFYPDNVSNARLIAAAPDLLDAAGDAFDFLGGVDGAGEVRARLLAAIVNATGPMEYSGYVETMDMTGEASDGQDA